jgi:hypothetical protein
MPETVLLLRRLPTLLVVGCSAVADDAQAHWAVDVAFRKIDQRFPCGVRLNRLVRLSDKGSDLANSSRKNTEQ